MADNNGGKREGAGRKAGTPNKSTAYLRELAGEHADDAIQFLADLVKDDKAPAAARVSASKEIIERGYGKSGNIVHVGFETPLSDKEPADALRAIVDKVVGGEISIDDGTKLTSMIEARTRVVEMAELEVRLSELENQKQ